MEFMFSVELGSAKLRIVGKEGEPASIFIIKEGDSDLVSDDVSLSQISKLAMVCGMVGDSMIKRDHVEDCEDCSDED